MSTIYFHHIYPFFPSPTPLVGSPSLPLKLMSSSSTIFLLLYYYYYCHHYYLTYWIQLVLPASARVEGWSLAHGQPTQRLIPEETCLSLPQQPSATHSPSSGGGPWWALPPAMLKSDCVVVCSQPKLLRLMSMAFQLCLEDSFVAILHILWLL